jgi:hypothetical protein
MKNTMMIRALAALAVCTLIGTARAQPCGDRSPQSFRIEGHVIMLLDTLTGTFRFTDEGVSSLGRFTNEGIGQVDVNGVIVWSVGVATLANGDELSWAINPGSPNTVVWTGGTGRFEDVSGGFDFVRSPPTLTPGPTIDLVIVTYDYKGAGTIAYCASSRR